MTFARKPSEITPFHHLRIVEKADDSRPAEKAGIVVTHVYLDDKELHGPFENELRIVYGPEQLTVAYIPVVVASVVIEREIATPEPPAGEPSDDLLVDREIVTPEAASDRD